MRRILVVDDEPKILKLIRNRLEEAGHRIEICGDVTSARALLADEIFDLLITDVRLPDASGVDLLEYARQAVPGIQVILITAYGTVSEGVSAMKLGAFDYLLKPFEMEALHHLAERALGHTDLREELQVLKADVRRRRGSRELVGDSPAMQRVKELIARVAPTPSTVLIQGESGTGKELAAETIHRLSPKSGRPLVRVNCLAIQAELMESELFGHVKGAFTGATSSHKGLFELADGGSLLLDEVADLPLELQGKLLRALEERSICRVGSGKEIPVELRLIAATNVDLAARVAAGRFREDLYYRLCVFPIDLPPLRERAVDIPPLAQCLLGEIATRLGWEETRLNDEAAEALTTYRWPGNVRELRNILERASVLAGDSPIELQHLPTDLLGGAENGAPGKSQLAEKVESYRRQLLLETLQQTAWVKKDAAERLGLSPRALSHYISKYDLDRFRGE